MSDELKWSKDRHDERAKAKQEELDAEIRGRVMERLGTMWDRKKAAILRKKITQDQLEAELLKLNREMRDFVEKECDHPCLRDFREMVTGLLDDRVEETRITEAGKKNCLIPFVLPANPTMLVELPKVHQPVVVRLSFDTEAQLRELEHVKAIINRNEFKGFLLIGKRLVALFTDAKDVQVGTVSNFVGLDRVPGIEDLQKAENELRDKKARNKRKAGKRK